MIKKGMNALLLLCILLVCNGKSGAMEKEGNNALEKKVSVESDRLPIADPYVMLYNNKYYAYGTGGTTKGEGFACFSSDDLKNWKREGQALSAADSYGKWGFWAPEVYYIESKKKFGRRAYLCGYFRLPCRPVPAGSETTCLGGEKH